MKRQPLVLAISNADDTQLEMLSAVPHVRVRSVDDLTEEAKQAEAILHWAGSRELLRQAFVSSPKVRWVHSRSAGLDKTLFPELVESAVPVTNGSGVFSQSLGEFALAMILYFAKDMPRMLRNKSACRWEQFDVEEIGGQTVGIVGYGDIGRAVVDRVHAMGMRVLAIKRHAPVTADPKIAEFFPPQQMTAMLGQCDYVVVALPLTAETHHMISDTAFAAMKPSAVLINIGRGPVVDQAALVHVLQEGKIKGAGLDVFEQEPIPADDPIFKLENVFISPHCADNTKDWLNDAMKFFLAQYERFSNGERLKNVVEKHLGY
jgi:phosphoglycerate dehydrogenase-like enzyme